MHTSSQSVSSSISLVSFSKCTVKVELWHYYVVSNIQTFSMETEKHESLRSQGNTYICKTRQNLWLEKPTFGKKKSCSLGKMKTALLTSGSISGNLWVSAVLRLESKQPVLRCSYKWGMLSDSSLFELHKWQYCWYNHWYQYRCSLSCCEVYRQVWGEGLWSKDVAHHVNV